MRTFTKIRDLKPGESMSAGEVIDDGIHGAMQHLAMFTAGRQMKDDERAGVIAFEIETRVIVHRVVGRNEVDLWNKQAEPAPSAPPPASKEHP